MSLNTYGDVISPLLISSIALPTWPLNFETPLSLLIKKYPHMSTSNNLPLKTFWMYNLCSCYDHHYNKLDPRAIKIVFIGYSPTQKGYCYYCPQTRKTYVSRDVTFVEDTPYFFSTLLQGGNPNKTCWDTSPLPTANPIQVLKYLKQIF